MARAELSEDALVAALRGGDAAAVVALLARATDRERARLRPVVEAEDRLDPGPPASVAHEEALEAAVLSTYTVKGLTGRQRRRPGPAMPQDLAAAALRPRTARFKASLARAVRASPGPAWGCVRPLVQAGLLAPGAPGPGGAEGDVAPGDVPATPAPAGATPPGDAAPEHAPAAGWVRLRPADAPLPVQPGPEAAVTGERRLAAVDDLDELVSLLAAAMEGGGPADDVERALGAVVRMGGARPAGFADLVGPLRARAAELLEGRVHGGASGEIARVVAAWAGGRGPAPGAPGAPWGRPSGLRGALGGLLGRRPGVGPEPAATAATPARFLRGRVDEIVGALTSGGPWALLSEPTHRGGRLDPEVAASRGAGPGRDGLGPHDRRQAALRVAAGHEWPHPLRLDAADGGAALPGEGSAVRFVRDTPPDGRDPDPLVAAAEGYLALTGAQRFHASAFRPFWDVVSDGLGARLAVATLAGRPDIPAAMAAVGLAERARQATSNWVDPLPMVEQLGDPAVPLQGAGAVLLVLALAGSAEHRGAGVAAAAAAVGDGRFDPVALARATAALQRADVAVLAHLPDPVADLAAAGPLPLLRSQQYLLALVEALAGHGHGLHGPLETLARLSGGGIVVPETAGRLLRSLADGSSGAAGAAATVVANAVA